MVQFSTLDSGSSGLGSSPSHLTFTQKKNRLSFDAFFLPFSLAKTCKTLPTNNGLLMRNTV